MNILEAHNIHKIYSDGSRVLEVLKGVEIKIEEGKILAIVGPSGAGKSTLLHILGGLDKPSKGNVIFKEKDIYKMPDSERARVRNRQMGFVFQFYHLLPEFNALENVYLPALIKGMKKEAINIKAEASLKHLGLGSRLGHYPSQLSGGEMQRVAIARALINDPEILFCDEPTGNLDSATGAQIKELIWDLNKQNNYTVVIVTHDEHLVKDAHRVLRIKDGLIKEGG